MPVRLFNALKKAHIVKNLEYKEGIAHLEKVIHCRDEQMEQQA